MKHITVEVSGSKREPVEMKLEPGVTAGEILSALQLEGYVLCTSTMLNADWLDTDRFSFEEVVYDQVMEGERLFALTSVEAADRFMEKLAFGEAEPSQEAQR